MSGWNPLNWRKRPLAKQAGAFAFYLRPYQTAGISALYPKIHHPPVTFALLDAY